MKRLDFIATLSDDKSIFFVAFNDNKKDPYSGYFATWENSDKSPEIKDLKPIALAEIQCNNEYISDELKSSLYAKHLQIFGDDALKECITGCRYNIKLNGEKCFAFHLSNACKLLLNNSK